MSLRGEPSSAPHPYSGSVAPRERAGHPTLQVPGSGPGREPGSGCARATQPAPRDLTWAGLGSSAGKGVIWTAPLRGVRSSGCLWTSESSSWSPGEGTLAPSMDSGARPHRPRGNGSTYPRVQSPKLPPGWLTLRPGRVGRGAGRGVGETSGCGRGRELRSGAEEGCFSGLFRALPALPFPVLAHRKPKLSRPAGWLEGCGTDGLAAPRRRRK